MKTARVLSVVVCALAMLALVGCGCDKLNQAAKAVQLANDARDGKMTVTNEKGEKTTIETQPGGDKSGKTTVTTKEGTTTTEVGTDKVSAQDVGIDFYPGATVEQSSSTSTTGEKGGKYSVVTLSTSAAFKDVAKFYKDKYAEGNTVMEQPNSLMITVTAGENSGKMIMVMSENGKTQIMIHAGSSM
jgi:hypothetical protein